MKDDKPEIIQARKEAARKDIVKYDPLQRYLAEIRHLPSLSKQEEHELAIKYSRGADMAAGYKLVLANLRLVVMVAREYQKNVQNILDLVQEGNVGFEDSRDLAVTGGIRA